MSGTIHYLDNEALRKEVKQSISDLSSMVSVTLGPGGRPVLLEQGNGLGPLSTKDGVTVARFFNGTSNIARVVADAAREVCERTARVAGDGTTTAIVLASALVKEGQEYIVNHPSDSPQKLSRDLRNIFLNKIKPEILALSKSIKGLNPEDSIAAITHVAKVSANHDSEIAEKVAEGVSKVGENGMVIAEEGAGAETTLVINKGFPINSGLKDLGGAASTIFVNGNHGDCKIDGGLYIVLYDGEIREIDTIMPLLEKVNAEIDQRGYPLKTPIAIFAHGYSDLVLKSLGQNFRQNRFTCIPLVTPRNGQDHYRQSFLHDLSAYVGGTVFDPHSNNLKDLELGQLGAANSIKAGQNEIVIMATPEIEVLEARIEELKSQQERASDFDADRIRYRLGQLTGGVATIFAGGVTAFEAKERHARVVDAISAVRSAIDMGVVPGGGSTLLYVASKLSDTGPESIFKKALTVPFSTIVTNAGGHYDISMEKIGPNENDGFMVYDALNMKLVDWWESGILDPVKVTLTALENALSVAQLLMTLGGLIAVSNSEEENKIKMMQQGMIRAMNQEV